MTIAITGATGFLGAHLLKALPAEQLVILGRRDPILPTAVFHQCSIDGDADFNEALVGVKIVIHCAARAHIMDDCSIDPLKEFRVINTQGTLNLARQSAEAGVKRFIFLSSIKVNGERTKPGSPFITCYLGHLLKVEQLKHDFPNALFIVLRRDPVANALSLLRCRQKQNDPKAWFSVKPRDCQNIEGGSEYAQVVQQVKSLNKVLDSIEKEDNTFSVNYDDICKDPNSVMNNFKLFAKTKGYKLSFKNRLPETFINKFNPECDDALILKKMFQHSVRE